MSSNFINNMVDEIFDEKPKPSKYPFWVHLVGKLSLQFVSGIATYLLWSNGYKFFGFITGFLFIYFLTILLFGHVIKKWCREMLS